MEVLCIAPVIWLRWSAVRNLRISHPTSVRRELRNCRHVFLS